jgi:hypothetical protein
VNRIHAAAGLPFAENHGAGSVFLDIEGSALGKVRRFDELPGLRADLIFRTAAEEAAERLAKLIEEAFIPGLAFLPADIFQRVNRRIVIIGQGAKTVTQVAEEAENLFRLLAEVVIRIGLGNLLQPGPVFQGDGGSAAGIGLQDRISPKYWPSFRTTSCFPSSTISTEPATTR